MRQRLKRGRGRQWRRRRPGRLRAALHGLGPRAAPPARQARRPRRGHTPPGPPVASGTPGPGLRPAPPRSPGAPGCLAPCGVRGEERARAAVWGGGGRSGVPSGKGRPATAGFFGSYLLGRAGSGPPLGRRRAPGAGGRCGQTSRRCSARAADPHLPPPRAPGTTGAVPGRAPPPAGDAQPGEDPAGRVRVGPRV